MSVLKIKNIESRLNNILKKKLLSSSERRFAESLYTGFKKYKTLTYLQSVSLAKLEQRYTIEAVMRRKQWANEWSDEKKEKIKIAANYYMHNPPFFGQISWRILNDEEWIPSEDVYFKMTANKYIKKVLASAMAAPLFDSGDFVVVRKSAARQHTEIRGETGIVISSDGIIKSAAKNAKNYTIMLLGETQPIEIEERWLKSPRDKKLKYNSANDQL